MSRSSTQTKDSQTNGQILIGQDHIEVTLDPEDDPQKFSSFRRWTALLVISSASLCVTCASSIVSFVASLKSVHLIRRKASFTEAGIAKEFDVSKEITVLGLSLFVMGLGLGPLLVGPLSEVYGRNIVYRISYMLFFVFSWPVAFTPDIGMQIRVFSVCISD
jgi:MFS family permease